MRTKIGCASTIRNYCVVVYLLFKFHNIMYWYELTRKQKILFILYSVVGTLLFFWLPGVFLGVFAAGVIILGILGIIKIF